MENLTSVKRGVTKSSPCNRFLVEKKDLCKFLKYIPRSQAQTIAMLEHLNNCCDHHENISEMFGFRYMVSIAPLLPEFQFMSIFSTNNIYNIYKLKPMHIFSLSISKALKECIGVTLKDKTIISHSNGYPRPFKFVRRKVLFDLNDFLWEVQLDSVGYGLRVYFSKGHFGSRLYLSFNEKGIIGMLEASD